MPSANSQCKKIMKMGSYSPCGVNDVYDQFFQPMNQMHLTTIICKWQRTM